MEKEENQNNTSIDENQDKVKETGKPDEKLDAENKQETDKEPKEKTIEPTTEEKIAELEDKVTRTFAENNVPLVNIMKINKIIDGILPHGPNKNKIGDGEIYFTERYNLLFTWISTIISIGMILGIGFISHRQVNERLKSFNPDSTL